MAYATAEAQQELLDTVAGAADDLAAAVAALGTAYELLDDASADRLEEELFRPLQLAYGRAKRTHAGFAERAGRPERAFAPAPAPPPSHGVKALLETASAAIDRADAALSELQDSLRPVEVGDAELRAGLADVRSQLGSLRGRSREFGRTLGR